MNSNFKLKISNFHQPVLLQEVLEVLNPCPGGNFIDATVGQGGHAEKILEQTAPNGKLLGIDADEHQIRQAKNRLAAFGDRVKFVYGSYANVAELSQEFSPVNGILLDLGFSSWHIDQSGRGFSFAKHEPLDMRYDIGNSLSAEQVVNGYPERDLERIFKEFGEERFAGRIARAVCRARQTARITATQMLQEIITASVPGDPRTRADSVRRIFQALRIEVNSELESLKTFLPQALNILAARGRLAVISFHSLEDRMVKNFFKEAEETGVATIVTKKPIIASAGEVAQNPRAHSAKMRAIIKI